MAHPKSMSRETFHSWIYYFSLCLFVVSLSTSRFVLTLSIVLMSLNWLAEGNFRQKFIQFRRQDGVVAFLLIFALSVLGVLWAHDRIFALHALQHKLPTLLLPIVMVTSPALTSKQIRTILFLFISSVVVVSFIGLAIRVIQNPINFREASPFVPATNYSMLLVLAAFQLPILVRQISEKRLHLMLSLAVSGWLVYFIFYLRSFTGLASLGGALAYLLIIILFYHQSKALKVGFALLSIGVLAFGVWLFSYMYSITHTEITPDFSALPKSTQNGTNYKHDTANILRENGHLVYLFIAEDELRVAWNNRSKLAFDSLDRNSEPLKHTLYRYMASKGLTKDSAGLAALTNRDIKAVEDGYTNFHYIEWPGFYSRVHILMMGFYMYSASHGANPTWSTFTERLELWKASWVAFKEYPLLGWGTGHIERAVEYGLQRNSSVLANSNLRSHNQYISLLLLWGVVGFVAFISLLVYIIIKTKVYKLYIFNVFVVVFAINGLVNDPLEGQVGQCMFMFFTLFYSYFYTKVCKGNSLFDSLESV
ncbi:MAG: O-antigen ligase family protein [Tenuifilaceae bacterium]|nr:O-antigen ligase family protein [Tenuifilaceae bacterium]